MRGPDFLARLKKQFFDWEGQGYRELGGWAARSDQRTCRGGGAHAAALAKLLQNMMVNERGETGKPG